MRGADGRLSAAVAAVLDRFAAPRRREASSDPGPLVLTSLAAHDSAAPLHERAVEAWLDALDGDARTGNYAAGPTAPMVGLAAAKPVVAGMGRLNRRMWEAVAEGKPWDRWRARGVSWADYDVISGPAGMLLGLRAAGPRAARRLASACARQLLALCGDDDLASLRLGRQRDERLRWNEGRINTGLAHGVAGVALGLGAAVGLGLRPAGPLRAALARVSDWLVAQSHVDGRGLKAWPGAGLDGAEEPPAQRRQAWCYGAPGVAWALWESGRVLGRQDLRDFGRDAIVRFCRRFEPRRYLDAEPVARLGFCHGAAGTLAVADCFAIHARCRPAARLALRIERLLSRRLDEIVRISAGDASLLTGAPGMLAMLLTRRGAPRTWLVPLGLR